MTPAWVDYLGAFSAAAAAVLALFALRFAVKAGRDLTHDRRDTFEIGILREMLDCLDMPFGRIWPPPWFDRFQTLRDLVGQPLRHVESFIEEATDLGQQDPEIRMELAEKQQLEARNETRQQRRSELLQASRADIYSAIDARVGRSRRPNSRTRRALEAAAARVHHRSAPVVADQNASAMGSG